MPRKTLRAAMFVIVAGLMAETAAAAPVVLETAAFTTSSDIDTVGIPQNNGAFWDGSQYWLIWAEGNTLQAKHGSTLGALAPTATHPSGTGGIDGLINNKTFSVVYGRTHGQWHAWALVNRNDAATGSQPFSVYRWDLTPSGLANPTTRLIDVSDKPAPTHVTLMPDGDDFKVQDLYGVVHAGSSQQNQQTATRRVAADLGSDVGLTGPKMSDTKFAEATWVFEVDNGLVLDSINVGDFPFGSEVDGDFGHFSEWTRTGVADPAGWGNEAVLDADGPGRWRDQNYAADTSHAGQVDFIQLTDGTVFNAYVDNADKAAGNFGRIVLKERGNLTASTWSIVSTDAVDGGGEAWHLALTSDGKTVWLLYVKDEQGARDGAIYLRGYDPESERFTAETRIADITAGRTFQRMTTQWRFDDDRLVVLWSETQDGTTYGHVTALAIPEPGALSLVGLSGAAALVRRRSRDRR